VIAAMRKKRILFVMLGLLCAAALAGLLYCLFPPKPVLEMHWSCIREIELGISTAEACDLVGFAPGDYSGAYHYGTGGWTGSNDGDIAIANFDILPNGAVSAVHSVTGEPIQGHWWRGRQGMLVVFSKNDRIIEKRYYDGYPMSFWEYCRDRWERR
jgi:hypothetical protein